MRSGRLRLPPRCTSSGSLARRFAHGDGGGAEILKDTLEKRGALGQIKARIRAEVFNALDDQSEPRPPLSHENLLINELIREYLEYNKYKYASSVLTAALLAALNQIIPLVFKKSCPLLLILENLASLKCPWIDSFLPKS
ncbi:centrosomal protein 20 isoform X5 [Phalacrocorax carbo]|uniref:centrosomal protein 20 isoform X5 n=1 Tax=Phalacrocorax carbo TaxID=9209 RepID=UPI003119825E